MKSNDLIAAAAAATTHPCQPAATELLGDDTRRVLL